MKVIETIQGQLLTNGVLPEPVELTYYSGDSRLALVTSVAQIIENSERDSRYVKVLAIRIEL